jgi:hypothetical protein
LAACEIRGEDTWRELQTLCAAHGIGYIRIDPEDPDGCRILIPARGRDEIDWASANRIAAENADFSPVLAKCLKLPADWSAYGAFLGPIRANETRPPDKESGVAEAHQAFCAATYWLAIAQPTAYLAPGHLLRASEQFQ